jgi:feruloyl esterase
MRVPALTFAALCVMAAPAVAQPFAGAATSASRYTVADEVPRRSCESLASVTRAGLVSLRARVVAATPAAPEHCRVTGVIDPEVAFEVDLPARWNSRFYMTGNGGLAGQAVDGPLGGDRAAALTHGFVIAQTNTGHDAQQEPGGTFILSNPQKAIDYAYRAVHVTAETARAIADAYYGSPVTFAYWNSCSNGGRQGLIEAQRFPDDFDGIVANAPWTDQTGFTMGAMWNQKAMTEAPVSPAKLTLLAERVVATCDAVDGLEDGLIDDPRACRFDPARDVPACAAGADGPDCLTPAQAAAIAKVYGGPVGNGRSLAPGFMPGSEVVTTGRGGRASAWVGTIAPTGPEAKPADFNLAENIMRYLVLDPPQPDYDYRTFDYDRDPALVQRWSELADAKDPDLSAFRASGGKLIMTYGWADQILQPMMGVNYYESVRATHGESTDEFARLFMMPGVTHCSGGVGPDQVDAVTAVIDWVETNRAPDSLLASKVSDGEVVRTRPLCPYPQVARYRGQGSIDDAASFRCVAP